MRILQLIGQLNYGGAAALVTQWAKQLDISGHKIEVCALYSKGYYAKQLEIRDKHRVIADYMASMSDRFAMSLFNEVYGR